MKKSKKVLRSRYFHVDSEVYGKLGRQAVSSVMFLRLQDRKRKTSTSFSFSLRSLANVI
jgi:hypothetical protein